MMLPPAFLRLRLRGPNSAWPSLWLPLFLLWPLLLLLFVLAITVGVLLLSFSAQVSAANALKLCTTLYRVLCATRGTQVDVVGARSQVLVSIY